MASIRLRRVPGLEGRANDVVLAPPARRPAPAPAPAPSPEPPDTLVFFGGDVQDYPEVMAAHRDNRHYVKWNLESTARSLASRFPDKYILVVRPSRIEFKSFSCYDNFVPSNNAGVPDHTPTHAALLHLEKLLQGAWARLQAMPVAEIVQALAAPALQAQAQSDIEDLHNATVSKLGAARAGRSNGATTEPPAPPAPAATQPESENERDSDPLWWLSGPPLGAGRLWLAGFSKGCVVLNQLIYEFHYTKTLTPGDAHMMRFIERISEMYWLDGGHAGGKNTWITSRSLLETLTRLDVSVWVHVSPYQVCDGGRPWIGREEHAFTHLLAKLGAKVQRHLHDIPGAPHNLHMHFSVLDKFHSVHTSAPDGPARASAPDGLTQASAPDGLTPASVIDGLTQASVIDCLTQASTLDGPTQASAPEGTKPSAPALIDSSDDET